MRRKLPPDAGRSACEVPPRRAQCVSRGMETPRKMPAGAPAGAPSRAVIGQRARGPVAPVARWRCLLGAVFWALAPPPEGRPYAAMRCCCGWRVVLGWRSGDAPQAAAPPAHGISCAAARLEVCATQTHRPCSAGALSICPSSGAPLLSTQQREPPSACQRASRLGRASRLVAPAVRGPLGRLYTLAPAAR